MKVLVEFDNSNWETRDWLKVRDEFKAFLVEKTLVLAEREDPLRPRKKCWWPGLVSGSHHAAAILYPIIAVSGWVLGAGWLVDWRMIDG